MFDQLGALDEPLKAVCQSIVAPQTTYVRKDAIDLERTADQEPWFPSEQTGSLIESLHQIKVIIIDEKCNLSGIRKDIVRSNHVGLVLMGSQISRKQRPQMIVLTTELDKFYIIEPNDEKRGIPMLKKLLKDPNIRIWTTNGLYEADCLYHQYGIKLHDTQAKCCTGLHINLMRIMKPFPNHADKMLTMYHAKAFEASRTPDLRLESFERMASLWLDADTVDLQIDKRKLIHLDVRPLNLTAINLIKKRCCLVIKLAQTLLKYMNVELTAMSKNVLNCLAFNDNHKLREALRDEIMRCEKKGIASVQYFAHLNGIFANPKSCLRY